MTNLKCNSCGATWQKPKDGQPVLPHVCPAELINQHAACDPVTGKVITAATFKPVDNPRNENFKPHPENRGEFVMVSEGNGVTESE